MIHHDVLKIPVGWMNTWAFQAGLKQGWKGETYNSSHPGKAETLTKLI